MDTSKDASNTVHILCAWVNRPGAPMHFPTASEFRSRCSSILDRIVCLYFGGSDLPVYWYLVPWYQQENGCVQLKDAREKVRGTEVEALRTRNELKAALMSVNELTNEVSPLSIRASLSRLGNFFAFRFCASVYRHSLAAVYASSCCTILHQ